MHINKNTGIAHLNNLFGFKANNIRKKFKQKYQITPNGCWLWIGATRMDGTGIISIHIKNNKRTTKMAHVISYELHFGKIPNQYKITHKCNNRSCVNPSHLILEQIS